MTDKQLAVYLGTLADLLDVRVEAVAQAIQYRALHDNAAFLSGDEEQK